MSTGGLPAPDGIDVDIVMVEDAAPDVELAIVRLTRGGFRCQTRVVASEAELREALEQRPPDFILSDFSLPAFDGMAALAVANELAPGVPFIFLSGTMGEERAVEALRRGAVDYVLKSNPLRLVPAVKRALAEAELRRASRAAQMRVAHLTDVLQMLSGINTAVVRIQNRDSLLKEACRLAHSLGGYPMAVIATVEAATRKARLVASAGLLTERVSSHLFNIAESEDADATVMGRVMQSGEAFLCNDVARTIDPAAGRDDLLATGIRAFACLPLRVDETAVGAFLVGTREPELVSQDELKLLGEVAANLSFALQYLEKQEAVNFLAYFDPMTGLAKRALFCERLGRHLVRGAARLPRLAVKVFDIDHLSVINDSFGRHVGDRLLQCVAERLKAHCSDTERVAVLGGGTFVAVTALGENMAEEIHDLHQAIMRLFDAPFAVGSQEIAVTVKCGIACYPENGTDPNELVQNAEAALKEAKSSGEKYLHHRLEMNSALAERVRMEYRLRSALQEQQFELHYQPKVRIRTGMIDSAEALVRWRDPERGLIAPGVFLPILDSAGLMPAISAWVLKRAVADNRLWQLAGLPPVRVAVNISPPELRRRGFVQKVLEEVGSLNDEPEWGIDIEVTEGALFGDSEPCIHALRLLRTAGMRVAIDDFGTGYSSLSRLSELPIDSLKIDRTFTNRLPEDRKICTLVSTMIELAHVFGMTTVAEGVESVEQLEYLRNCGCDESQGFLHSRAIPSAEFQELLLRVNRPGVRTEAVADQTPAQVAGPSGSGPA